ncbi:MAG: peptide chain release factor 2 [Chloroflexi bacterium OLB15]|nr:MAG: peptide chain release factor 2 [Chloroflexi bacterium OLB15]
MENITALLEAMQAQIHELIERVDLDSKARRAADLEIEASAPDFWSNPELAQRVMQEISRLKGEIEHWNTIRARINDTLELAQLEDATLHEDLANETRQLQDAVEGLSLQTLLNGQYDDQNAIFAIHAGAGGTDSQDWALMLERMYLRWFENNGYKVEILDRSEGEEAGLKSVTMSIKGDYAYGYLQSEQGVHRLVRISPFDAAKRRHTSFSKVELWPDIEGDIEIEISEKDLKIETYRSSGAGGQNVQKNDTAVRLTHIPTGIVVSCQNQRSQTQNRERAMQILKARLFEIERKKRDQQIAALKGDIVSAEWGNQIRSYVLHPYRIVKDHRTGFEDANTDAVLDGRLSGFMEAYLRAKVNQTLAQPDAALDLEA